MGNIIITIIITVLATMFVGGYFFDKAIERKEKELKRRYSFDIDILKSINETNKNYIENLKERLNKKPQYSIAESICHYNQKQQKSEAIKASDIIEPNAFDGIKKDIQSTIELLNELEKKLKDLGK